MTLQPASLKCWIVLNVVILVVHTDKKFKWNDAFCRAGEKNLCGRKSIIAMPLPAFAALPFTQAGSLVYLLLVNSHALCDLVA